MGTFERETPVQPIFAAVDGRRERLLRTAARSTAVLVALWLTALLAGAVGFGRLPGVPGSALLEKQKTKAPEQARRSGPASENILRASVTARPGAAGNESPGRVSEPASARPPVRRPTPAQPAPPPAAQPAAPPVAATAPPVSSGNPQGRAVRRHGDRTQPVPPPPGNGNGNGNSGTPPGQLKRQLPSPLPPPPKK
jgi:hypothetical protein